MIFPKWNPRVLAIGAHPDDVELGAGGTIARLVREFGAVVHLLVFTRGLRGLPAGIPDPDELRRREALAAANELGVMNPERVEVLTEFRDCELHLAGHDLIRTIEDRLRRDRYDVVIAHAGEDTHADHRAVYEATLSAVRDFHGTVLHYQAPSSKPNGFRPTFFVRLTATDLGRKIDAVRCHISQRERAYTTESHARGMADTWARFLRTPDETRLEAFEVYKSFL